MSINFIFIFFIAHISRRFNKNDLNGFQFDIVQLCWLINQSASDIWKPGQCTIAGFIWYQLIIYLCHILNDSIDQRIIRGNWLANEIEYDPAVVQHLLNKWEAKDRFCHLCHHQAIQHHTLIWLPFSVLLNRVILYPSSN